MNHETGVCLAYGSALAAVHRILSAVRDRVYVARGAVDGIACGQRECGSNQNDSGQLLNHDASSSMGWRINAAKP